MRPVLVVIDVQNGFISARTSQILPVVIRLVTKWQAVGLPSVFTRFHNPVGGPYERLIGWSRLRSRPDTDLHPDLAPLAEVVIDKTGYSAFAEIGRQTSLLADGAWDTLVLCGIATDSCVLKTAIDAFERDLTPLVVMDACATQGGPAAHKAGLLVIGRNIGRDQLIRADNVLATVHESLPIVS